MNNILVVLGVVCLQVVLGQFTENDLPPPHIECLKELNLSAEVLLNNVDADFSVTEGDPDFNKLILCIYKKENLLNADDTLDNVEFHNFLTRHFMKIANINTDNAEADATNAINACISVQGTDPGDVVVKHINCILNNLRSNI